MDEKLRIATEAVRATRNATLDAAIGVCQEFARGNGSAEQCVAALLDLKGMMNSVAPPPSEAN